MAQGNTGPYGLENTYAGYSSGSGSGSSSRSTEPVPQSAGLPPLPLDTDMTYGGLLTPNTQTILQQFFTMSPAEAEQNMESYQADEATSMQLEVYSQSETMQSAWDPTNALIPTIPYEPTFMLPTGLNLLRPMPAYGDAVDMQQFFSTMDEEAVAYHLGLPLNLTKEGLQLSGPEPPPPVEDDSTPPFDRSNWFPNPEPAKKVKDPIDVPPFVRNKLLDSYFHNIQRCPCYYVDRERLNRRIESTENRPHPTWLYSMVSGLRPCSDWS